MLKIYLSFLLLLTGCATKYIVPGNRFMTPETNGGALRGQAEIQQTTGQQLKIDASKGTVTNGVTYSALPRTGFQVSNSFFEPFDLYWTHIGGGNSLLGGKFQFMGGSRTSKAVGHKLAAAASIGGNEHEPEDKSILFKLSGREFLLIYGYRLSEFILPYFSFSQAQYDFNGTIKKDPVLAGMKPHYTTVIWSFSPGMEFSYGPVVAKLEGTYQRLKTSNTKTKDNMIFGWSLGYAW